MRLLQNWYANRHVVSRTQILPILPTQIRLLYVQKQLRVERPQMASHKRKGPIRIALDSPSGKGPWVANLAVSPHNEVSVNEPRTVPLEYRTEQLEYLLAQQFVVPVHDQEDVLGSAVLLGRFA